MKWPRSARKPRASTMKRWLSPVGGWVANRNIAQPAGEGLPQAAAVLDNFFPSATTVMLRRGSELYATLGTDKKPVRALFKYVSGGNQKLFAATDNEIWNITAVPNARNWRLSTAEDDDLETDTGARFGEFSTAGLNILNGKQSGEWSVIQFATAGGIFLRGVNGVDKPFVYDGEAFTETPALEFESTVTDVKPEDMVTTWAYKNRLFFVQKDTLDVWYLPVDQVGGKLTKFPLGGVFQEGGSILFGATWSLDSGAQGGLSEQCVFITTEGEIAVYQGANPSDAADWSKVGVYRIGKPLGRKAWIRAGGDIIIATTTGFIPLSQAIQRDVAALSPAAVSYPIEDAWNEATLLRGNEGWHCQIWPDRQMVLVVPPHMSGSSPVMFAANALTGKWGRFTGWTSNCMEVFQGQLYFGSLEGEIIKANVGGSDKGNTYTGAYLPLFEDLGAPASLKIGELARFTIRAASLLTLSVNLHQEYDIELPTAPNATSVESTSEWGTAIWGQSVWGGTRESFMNNRWNSVGGSGYALSVSCQVTSGSIVPLDAEIISLDLTYQTADIVT
ncbi:hypothetical protein HBA93_06215 [Ochrobactrum sp. SFR4]|nr:hypothetical protein [Ochrobactrum sp. SFR4]